MSEAHGPHADPPSAPGGGERASGASAAPEADLLDHEYDGIREYDNPMPAWWKQIFFGTFVFSLGYLVWFHGGGQGVSVSAAYQEEQREAQERAAREALGQAVTEESLAALTADAASVAEGAKVFTERCVACHADKGQGLIGPNLTDSHFVHGAKLMDLYTVVSAGVEAKGMPPWERQLTPQQLRQVVAFAATLRHTNVAGKAAEGTLAAP